jgi:hypothetical protein
MRGDGTAAALDRFPDLRDEYSRNYRRVVWLAQHHTPELAEQAQAAAAVLGLPLEIVHTGDASLASELRALLHRAAGLTSPLPRSMSD